PARHPPQLPSFPTRRSSDLLTRERTLTTRGTLRTRGPPRSRPTASRASVDGPWDRHRPFPARRRSSPPDGGGRTPTQAAPRSHRSEEHTSELQSRGHLVCRL